MRSRPFLVRAMPCESTLRPALISSLCMIGLNLAALHLSILPYAPRWPINPSGQRLLVFNLLFFIATSLCYWRNRQVFAQISYFSAAAGRHYRRYMETAGELEAARRTMAHQARAQQTMISHANRAIASQYGAIADYADYLEERSGSGNPELRDHFDDICEAGFNLKLIATALELLQSATPRKTAAIPLAPLLTQMMLLLAASLERRAMQLDTSGTDLTLSARSDAAVLSPLLWMMLLGIIRYAQEESTMRLRCRYDGSRKQAEVSIIVSELAPGKLSPQERGRHLHRQMQHLDPHLFAETIRLQANIQLAELLLARIEGQVEVVPLSAYACEIRLFLPVA
jgi:hypothetical protein